MPKVKTNSSCKKRFKKSSSGKLKRSSAYRRHHAWAKSHKTLRKLRGTNYVNETQEKKITSVMPY